MSYPKRFKFGNLDIDAGHVVTVRALAQGTVFNLRGMGFSRYDYEHFTRKTLDELAAQGLAKIQVGPETVTYSASKLLLREAETAGLLRMSFDQMALKLNRDISPRAVRAKRRRPVLSRRDDRRYPTITWVTQQIDQEKRAGRGTENTPTEEGDEYQFSSSELTARYVTQFRVANHLT